MNEKFIDRDAIQEASRKLKELNLTKKRLGKDRWHDMRPFTGEIMYMAVECLFSRRHIANVLKARHKFIFSPDRIYSFVRSLNGQEWPGSRRKAGSKK